MVNKDSIALLPLDDRPVSYLLPKQIADFSGVNLILPEKDDMYGTSAITFFFFK